MDQANRYIKNLYCGMQKITVINLKFKFIPNWYMLPLSIKTRLIRAALRFYAMEPIP